MTKLDIILDTKKFLVSKLVYTTEKYQYYLRIFTYGDESVGKFSITYGYYLRSILPTDIIHRF